MNKAKCRLLQLSAVLLSNFPFELKRQLKMCIRNQKLLNEIVLLLYTYVCLCNTLRSEYVKITVGYRNIFEPMARFQSTVCDGYKTQ